MPRQKENLIVHAEDPVMNSYLVRETVSEWDMSMFWESDGGGLEYSTEYSLCCFIEGNKLCIIALIRVKATSSIR